ncbi:MAG: tetratricopeptide repeat protein [Spirochaetales bacterium]|nr:tetratricopeptide repeat protein [Spirochaetales bacterium]
MKAKLFFFLIFIFLGGLVFGGNIEADKLLTEGLTNFQNGNFQKAADKFTLIVQSPYLKEYHSISYFMLAKSFLALDKLKEASSYLEYYLLNFKNHVYYSEGYYLKAKLLFQQGDIENAIKMSEDFILRYPGSSFVPNAYFLIGECLYNKGQFDKAISFYRAVAEKYPASYKVEAAQYRLSIIGFKKREAELLKLLKWSYEDSLAVIEEYQRREKTYQQAIAAFQGKRSATGLDDADTLKELELKLAEKELELGTLQKNLEDLKKENDLLQGQLASATESSEINPVPDVTLEMQQKIEMLELKEKALEVKEQYLKWLESYLENEQ